MCNVQYKTGLHLFNLPMIWILLNTEMLCKRFCSLDTCLLLINQDIIKLSFSTVYILLHADFDDSLGYWNECRDDSICSITDYKSCAELAGMPRSLILPILVKNKELTAC